MTSADLPARTGGSCRERDQRHREHRRPPRRSAPLLPGRGDDQSERPAPGAPTGKGGAHGDDGAGQGRAGGHRDHQVVLPQGRGLLDAAVRGRSAHLERPHRRRGRARHRCRRPPAAHATSSRSTATPARSSSSAAAGCAGAPATWSGSSRTARRWRGRPGCSTPAGARCAGCRRRSSAAPTCDAEAAWRGAFLAHGSLTEPGRSLGARGHLPGPRGRARAGRRRPPAGHRGQGPRGPRRRPGRHPRRRRDRRAAHPAGRPRVACWPGRSVGCAARCGPRRTGWPTSTTRTCAARPAPRSRPEPGSSGRWRSSATTSPTTCGRRGAADREQAGQPRGARPAARPAADQGRGRRPDPPAARDGRQAGARDLGIPDTEAVLTPEMLDDASLNLLTRGLHTLVRGLNTLSRGLGTMGKRRGLVTGPSVRVCRRARAPDPICPLDRGASRDRPRWHQRLRPYRP